LVSPATAIVDRHPRLDLGGLSDLAWRQHFAVAVTSWRDIYERLNAIFLRIKRWIVSMGPMPS